MILAEIKREDTDYYWKIFICNEHQFLHMAESRRFVISQFITFSEEDAVEGLLKHFGITSNHQ